MLIRGPGGHDVRVHKIRQKSQKFLRKYNKLENWTEYEPTQQHVDNYKCVVVYWCSLPVCRCPLELYVNRKCQLSLCRLHVQALGGIVPQCPIAGYESSWIMNARVRRQSRLASRPATWDSFLGISFVNLTTKSLMIIKNNQRQRFKAHVVCVNLDHYTED